MAKPSSLTATLKALGEVLDSLERLGSDDDKYWVLQTAATRIVPVGQTGGLPGAPPTRVPVAASAAATGMDSRALKEFMRKKDPKTDVQRIACLGYFLDKYRQMPVFKARDCRALNVEAAGPSMNVARAVNNAAQQSGYLAAAGGGKKQITNVGEDVVDALPDQEKVKEVDAKKVSRRARRNRGRRGRGAGK